MDTKPTWEAIDPFEKLDITTQMIRVAAKFSRDLDSKLDPNGPNAKLNLLSSAARAVFFNDIELANCLLRVSHGASEMIFICNRTYKVKLVSPSRFAECFRVAREKSV